MKDALGLVEIRGMSTAIQVADTMVKTANVRIVDMENTRGLGYMTIKVAGDVGAVTAAVEAGKKTGMLYDKFIAAKVIPRPAEGMAAVFCKEEEPKPKKQRTIEKPKTVEKPKKESKTPRKREKEVSKKLKTESNPSKEAELKIEQKMEPKLEEPQKTEVIKETEVPQVNNGEQETDHQDNKE
ncbi:MAG: BMC domain-containing protein [bacterium]|nr:BMC domain-containing protein [bacterium]